MSDTFCVLPWYSKEIYSWARTPCCIMDQTQTVSDVQKDLVSGVKAAACKACWDVEDQGLISRRQQENQFLDHKLNRDIDLIKQDCENNLAEPLLYQITVSNICNQACVSCNSASSSRWMDLDTKLKRPAAKVFKINLNNEEINYKHAKRISILGGEPFFDQQTFDLLQKLLDHGNTDCFVSIITNGSVIPNKKQLEILSYFTDLNICVSIDGIGPVFEYMRWPAKWSVLLDNLETYKKISKTFTVSYTVSTANIFYYQETVQWFKQNNLKYSHNMVNGPRWLNPNFMPLQLKAALPDQTFFQEWKTVNGQEQSINQFVEQLNQQDEVKKVSFRDYLPALARLLNNQ